MKRIFCYQILATLLFVTTSVCAQELRVKGNVTSSEDKLPVIGATVSVKGTTIGTATDERGDFELKVPNAGTNLTISSIGMKTKEVLAQNTNPIIIILDPDSRVLDDVVVTALGIKRSEKALGYSVQKVSGDMLNKVSGVDLTTSLTGKVAGLLVKNPSDFAVSPELTIRGEKPLLVIDGVPYINKTLSDMSSEDIESMSVLKGATASALYGFRGSNGAILITTKNGSNNAKGVTVDISSNTMFTAGFLAIPKKQSVYGRGSNNTYDKNSSEVWGTKMEGQILEQWDPYQMKYNDYEYRPIGRDNFKNFLEQGYVTNNNVNVSYKNDVAALRSSINWTQNEGQYPNQKLNKYTYTFGGDINLGKFKLNSNMSYSKIQSPNMGSNGYTSYDPMYSLLIWSGSDFDIRDYKNNYWIVPGEVQNFTYRSETNNPYFDAYAKTNEVSRDLFNADASVSYEFNNWLKVTARSGLDFFTDSGKQRISWGSYVSTGNTAIPGNPYTWNGTWTGGYNTGQTQGFSMNNDLLITGEKAISNFTVEYVAGGAISYNKNTNIYGMTVGGITSPDFFSLNASKDPARVAQSTAGQQVNSLYGRAAFSWNRMVYLDVTGRNDWSSTQSTTQTPSYFYPSVSSSFVISELMPSTKNWLDLLKVRGSWTESKRPAGIYDTNSVMTVNAGTWGTMNGATAPNSLYSPDIRPEKYTTTEVGLQGIIFHNRLSADVSYYDRRTSDVLMQGDNAAYLSEASGYTRMVTNTNEVRSRRGWELTLTGQPIKNRDWQWDLGFNWSTYATYWVQLDDVYTKPTPWTKVGARVDALVSKDYLRDPSGNMIYSNGNLQYSQYDSNFGWTDPNFVWGVNSTLRYKNFSLFASFDGVVGGLMNTRTESYMWQSGVHPNSVTEARAKDVATPGSKNYVGNGVKVVSGSATYDTFGNITADNRVFAPNDVASTYQQYVIDYHNSSAWGGAGSMADTYSKTFLKFRELSLTYNISRTLLSKWKIKAASVSFVGQNILLWAKDFKYSDPDGGKEDFSDPSVRYLGGNIKLTF